jgi:hypothetical protein
MFGINNNNYDWKEDPRFFKAKSTQAETLKQVSKTVESKGKSYIMTFLMDPARDKFFWADTLNAIVNGINTKEGTGGNKVLTVVLQSGNYTHIESGENINGRYFVIQDLNVINDDTIEQARKARGMNREGLNQRTKDIRLQINIPDRFKRKTGRAWIQQPRTS